MEQNPKQKICNIEIYPPIKLKQLSVIIILNHINNSLIMQKLYLTIPLIRGIIAIINYTCWISVYCTIYCHLIVKQLHFISVITPYIIFKNFRKKTKLVLCWIFLKGNASRFGSAIQILPSDIGEYSSFFFNPVVLVVFIFIL